MQTRITSQQDLLAFRDRLRDTLGKHLSIHPRESKVNELAAAALGARNFNTAMGMLQAAPAEEVAARKPGQSNHCQVLASMKLDGDLLPAPGEIDVHPVLLEWHRNGSLKDWIRELLKNSSTLDEEHIGEGTAADRLFWASYQRRGELEDDQATYLELMDGVMQARGHTADPVGYAVKVRIPDLMRWLEQFPEYADSRAALAEASTACDDSLSAPTLASSNRSRAMAVAAIVQSAGGKFVGFSRLQMTAYLLEVTGQGAGFPFEFRFGGPFSEELESSIADALALGFLRKEEIRAAWGATLESYYLDEMFQPMAAQPNAETRASLIGACAKANPVTLLMTAAVLFLRKAGHSNAWSTAASHWPANSSIERNSEAKALYAHLASLPAPIPLPAPGEVTGDAYLSRSRDDDGTVPGP